jgi:Zinc knuckle
MLHQKCFLAKLKKGGDPDLFISYDEDLRYGMSEIKCKIEDDQFFLHIINNLTPDYDQQVAILEKRSGTEDADKKLKIEEVRDELCLRYERMNKGRNDDKEGKDIAMYAGGKFKGKCNKCGKIGHKSDDCQTSGNKINNKNTNNNNNRNNRNNKDSPKSCEKNTGRFTKKFDGTSYYCNTPGHMVKDCFKKKKDMANTEKEAAHAVTDDENIVFVAMEDDVKAELIQEDMAMVTMDIPSWMGRCPYLLNRCGKCNVTFETRVIGMCTKHEVWPKWTQSADV